MSQILQREAKILSEATTQTVQALEYMSSILNSQYDSEAQAIHEQWKRGVSIDHLAEYLMLPTENAIEANRGIAMKTASILGRIYKVQQELYDVGNDINNLVMDIREIQAHREVPVIINAEEQT